MDLNTCMTVVSKISPSDSESVLARLEAYQAAGMSSADAQRLAGNDLLAEIDQEGAEMRALVREQHPDLFEAATAPPEPAPVKPRVFSDPAQMEVRQARDTSKSSAMTALKKRLMAEVPLMKSANTLEFQQRLQWLSEGMLRNNIYPNGSDYVFDQSEIAAYQKFKAERALINEGKALSEQTDAPAFKAWFGTNSTMVNKDGSPMVLYHGTSKKAGKFSSFRRSTYGAMGPAVYLGDSAEASAGYDGGVMMKVYARGKYLTNMQWTDYINKHGWKGAEEAATKDGWAGVYDEMFENAIAVWDPANIKSATDNVGTFDETANIRQSRDFAADMQEQQAWLNERAVAAGYADIEQLIDNDMDAFIRLAEAWREEHPMEVAQARSAFFSLPKFGAGSMIVEGMQDRYNRWKQTIDAVKKQGGVLTEANDFYRAEERYHGATSARIEDFDAEVKDFTKALAKDGFSIDDIQLYAYAKHAKERNAALRARREANATTGFDSWSGMTDEEADEILQAAIDEGVDAKLATHHATLMRWTQGTRDIMLDEGLITDEQYLTLNAAYDNYVPLRGRAGKTSTRRGTGSGFNIRGKETERAKGRYSMADNVIEYIIQDRAKTLIRAGKNQVLRSFLQFVIDNPSANLWQINAVERRPVMTTDDQGNQVIEEVNAVIKDETTIGIKDGGREVFVKILDQNLLEQMRNMNVDGVSKLIGAMLMSQRTLGRLYTSLNPVFTVLNGARDVTASTMAMIDETGFMGAGKLLVRVPGSMVEAWRAEFGNASPDYQLFRATGGKTGFMDFKDIDTLAKELQGRVAKAEMSAMDPRIWGPAALSLIEKINAGVENGTRFATFQASRSEGKSTAEAARISKNISVNFNRKGTWTPQLGAWFLFFNPAVQGSVSVASRLKSPKVLATLGAGMTGIAMLALQNASMGDDDDGVAWWDKVPQEVKDRNLIIVLPPTSTAGEAIPGSRNGRYVKIPMPYGWNWFATLANQAVDLWRHGQDKARGVDMATAAKNAASSFMGAYMPVQELSRSFTNPKSLALAAVPDFLNAPAQSLLNVNSFGRTMYPEGQYNEGLPDSSKYFAGQAGTIFQRTAEKLNEATGGNKYKSGALDFTPATLENLARSYGGGPVSFSLDLMNAVYVRQSIERPDLDVRRLPFIKQLYGRIDAETDRAMAYERMDKISEAVEPVKAAKRAKDMVAAKQLAEEGGPMYRLGGALETTRDQLGKMRKQELTIIAGKEPEALKYARLQKLDEQKRQVMQRLNKAFNDAARAPGTPEP